MEFAKIIPEIFYDLIGRVIPGSVAIWVWSQAIGTDPVQVVANAYGSSKSLSESAFVLMTTLLLISYLIGHLISPLSSLMHTYFLAKLFPRYFRALEDAISGKHNRYPAAARDFLTQEIASLFNIDSDSISGSEYRRATYLWNGWIRLANPTAGTKLAKMRAEYRMLEGLYVVFAIAGFLYPLSRWLIPTELRGGTNWAFVIGIAIAFALAAWSAARSFRTFQWAVINHYFQIRSSASFVASITDFEKSDQVR